jgi:hypothetical protein
MVPTGGDGQPPMVEFAKETFPYLAIPAADGQRLYVSL